MILIKEYLQAGTKPVIPVLVNLKKGSSCGDHRKKAKALTTEKFNEGPNPVAKTTTTADKVNTSITWQPGAIQSSTSVKVKDSVILRHR